MPAAAPILDPEEVARFDALGERWWDPDGPMAPLHRMTPIRNEWALDRIARRFERMSDGPLPLAGLSMLDIGCGAGLFAEPMARLGADVTGVDPAPASIAVARAHAQETGVKVDYRVGTVEDLTAESRRFDIVSAMEVVEHVPDVAGFVAAAASLVRPGGVFLASTVNRTVRSFALAIVGAEYILRWLDPGTHRWEQFVTPDELAAAARRAGLRSIEKRGASYDPLRRSWRLSSDLGINYFFAGTMPA